MTPPRLLMLAVPADPGIVGGQSLVVEEIRTLLEERGWRVRTADGWESPQLHSRLSRGHAFSPALRAWFHSVPVGLRRLMSRIAMPREHYVSLSRNLKAAGSQILAEDFDVLMVHADGAPPGLCRLAGDLAAAKARPFVVVSMGALADELRGSGWAAGRALAALYLGAIRAPGMFRPVKPASLTRAIFASEGWRAEAVRAGFPDARAETIYFGVPLPPAEPRPASGGNRILWVGRLSPEKGLHLLLQALPALRELLPGATVTAIAAQGSPAYRTLIEKLVRELGLDDVVTLRGPVPRAALATEYARHDALFFHSVFDDPVALVLMEAFAAGLPVASSAAAPAARLIRPGETCSTYDVRRADSVIQALKSALTDGPFRERVSANARRLVEAHLSMDAMGAAFDASLRKCLRPAEPPIPGRTRLP